jgi:murein DD-endopeptidase MepM/ murein hydrolase activator NlpD
MLRQICVIAALCATATGSFAQTPGGAPPNGKSTCDNAGLSGGALGLCRSWGEALDCERKDMMLGLVHAQAQACTKLADNFTKLSGRDLTHIFGVAVIPPAGGAATLDDAGVVTFPGGAFAQDTYVSVTKGQSADLEAAFLDTAAIYAPIATAGEQLHINTGAAPPISDTVTVQVRVPDRLLAATPDGYAVRLFAQLRQGNDEEEYDVFEAFDSTYDATTKTLTAQVPTAVFSSGRTAGDDFEAILELAVAPGATEVGFARELFQSPPCTDPIMCPVATGCTVTSPFQPARRNPVDGVVRPHTGVDYRAADGTQIEAAADGTVERAYTSTTYGNVVIIRHPDGAATLYAHLSELDVAAGNQVSQGDLIGLSGHTGRAAGPHLHFEYVPNGPLIRSPRRIDPEQCRDECHGVGKGILSSTNVTANAQQSQFSPLQTISYQGAELTTFTSSDSGSCSNASGSASAFSMSANTSATNCGINEPSGGGSGSTVLDLSRCGPSVLSGQLNFQLETHLQTTNNPGIFRQAVTSVSAFLSVSSPGFASTQSGGANVQNGPFEYTHGNSGFMSGMPENGGSKTISAPILLNPGQPGGARVTISYNALSFALSLEPQAASSIKLSLIGVDLFDANGTKLSSSCVCSQ